jgi:DNA-binding NtrC family response regulator
MTVVSGEECLAELPAFRPDVLLLDVKLPGIDGTEVLRRVRESSPDVAIIMMSAHATVDIAVAAIKRGATDFIVKPFDLVAVAGVVDHAVESSRLRRELEGLAAERAEARAFDQIVGHSVAMSDLRAVIHKVASSSASTLIVQGESGSGKEVLARCVHMWSKRAEKPFLAVNCTSLPEQLVESELFGHERGAFTDAKLQKKGLFELAAGGTVLLDEIGDMPLPAQAKLLRVLEQRSFKRVGGTVDIKADCRVIAATHRDIAQLVTEGRFRQDLYFRLNVLSLRMPPLREHVEDLPDLSAHLLAMLCHELGRPPPALTPETIEVLQRYPWPGNVRELRNVLERALILGAETHIEVAHLPAELRDKAVDPLPDPAGQHVPLELGAAEVKLIKSALEQAAGNQSQAARLLGISRDTLRYRLKKYGLE